MDDAASVDGGGSGGSKDSAKIEKGMGQPDEFPTDQAEELAIAAAAADAFFKTNQYGVGVIAVIEVILDILGDHLVARDLAITWGTCTTVADVKQDLTSAKAELDSYWENSGAKEGFNTYFGTATEALDTATDKFEKMSDTLVNSIAYIYSVWGEAINFLMDAASAAVLLYPPDTASAISTLYDKIGDLTSFAFATSGEFAADATTIETMPSQIEKPADLPGSVDEPSSWHVEPA